MPSRASFKAAVAQRPQRSRAAVRATPRRRLAPAGRDERRPCRGAVLAAGRRDLSLPPHQAERAGRAGRRHRSRWSASKPKRRRCRRASAAAQAIAAGVTLAREFGNRPGNHCTPTWLGQQAKKLGKAVRPRRSRCSTARRSRSSAWARSSPSRRARTNRRASSSRATRARPRRGAGRAGRQGHHLRHRRHLDQAGRRDGRDEVRHVRRRERARHACAPWPS